MPVFVMTLGSHSQWVWIRIAGGGRCSSIAYDPLRRRRRRKWLIVLYLWVRVVVVGKVI